MRRLALTTLVTLCCSLATVPPVGAGPVLPGKDIYGRYCVSCHGANGVGVTQAAKRAGGGPLRVQAQQEAIAPSLRGVGALAADFYLTTGYMPLPRIGLQPRRSRVLLTQHQIRALVAYVASLGKGPAIPKPRPELGSISAGQRLFTDHCAGCHQVAAAGGYVTGALPPPLEEDTPTQIAEAVRIGPYVMPTFTATAISDRQLDSIIRYVQYVKHPDDPGGWAIGHLGPVPEGLVTWLVAMSVLVFVCVLIGERLENEP